MKTEQIIILVVAFFLGMLLLNMVKNVCGCEVKEGFVLPPNSDYSAQIIGCNQKINDELGDLIERRDGEPVMNNEQNDACMAKLRGDICDEDVDTLCNLDIYSDNGRVNDRNVKVTDWFMDRLVNSQNRRIRDACSSFTDFASFKTAVLGGGECGPGHGGGPSYVLATNLDEGYVRTPGLSEAEAQRAACEHLQSFTECGQQVGNIPANYYKCMDGEEERPHQLCGSDPEYACGLTGNLPCPGTTSCPDEGCSQGPAPAPPPSRSRSLTNLHNLGPPPAAWTIVRDEAAIDLAIWQADAPSGQLSLPLINRTNAQPSTDIDNTRILKDKYQNGIKFGYKPDGSETCMALDGTDHDELINYYNASINNRICEQVGACPSSAPWPGS